MLKIYFCLFFVQHPAYGKRGNFRPQSAADFGDGGAFPEIHIMQYPLDMGRKDKKTSSGAVVPVKVDAEGKIRFDAVVTQHARKNQKVRLHMSHATLFSTCVNIMCIYIYACVCV